MDAAMLDGRRLRREQSRRRIIEAMIELVYEGVREPTAEQVAERAGLAMRTVFRHFKDMESLYREISVRMHARARELLDAGKGRPETLHAVVEARARVFEEVMPMRLSADVMRHRSPFLQREAASLVRLCRDTLERCLPASALPGRRDRLEALDALLSIETWIRLRRDQRLSAAAARRVLHGAVDALAGAGP